MSSITFLILLIIFSVILSFSIVTRIAFTPIHAIIDVILIICVIISIIKYIRKKQEKYGCDEYPQSCQNGKIVAGTVYASYPENTPGLGWIL